MKFRIRPPKDDKDENRPKKDPPPKRKAVPQPEPRSGDPDKKQDEPNQPGPPPPPPASLEKKVVVPLFGEGETVHKKGLVLVLDPGGGTDALPTRRPIDEALERAKRRAEEAVDRAGVRAEDRDLVRRYFELLEALRR